MLRSLWDRLCIDCTCTPGTDHLLFWCGPCDIIMPSSALLSNMLLLIVTVNILSIFLTYLIISWKLSYLVIWDLWRGTLIFSFIEAAKTQRGWSWLTQSLLSKIQYWTVWWFYHVESFVPNTFIWISFPLEVRCLNSIQGACIETPTVCATLSTVCN